MNPEGQTTPSRANTSRHYAVFISYRHADNREPDRQWATWLHHSLETYEVPPSLVGTPNQRGEAIPPSLYPVFRDEEELPADADLTSNIRKALENSSLLVVVCSPRAVASRFVAEEIRYFKQLGKGDCILALMVDGEPNASDDPAKQRAAVAAEQECLPEPLRFGTARDDGSVDWTKRTEPIAADVRPSGRPEQGYTTGAAYREALLNGAGLSPKEIDRLVAGYVQRLELAKLKVVAGALGVPLGALTQRDKAYQLEKERRRARALTKWLLVVGILALLAAVGGVLAWRQRQEAVAQGRARMQLLQDAGRSEHAVAENLFRDGNWEGGVTHLARSLTYDPNNWTAGAHLWSAIVHDSGKISPKLIWRFDYAARSPIVPSAAQATNATTGVP